MLEKGDEGRAGVRLEDRGRGGKKTFVKEFGGSEWKVASVVEGW